MVKIDGRNYSGKLLSKLVDESDESLRVFIIHSKEWKKKGWYPYRVILSIGRFGRHGLPSVEAATALPLGELLKKAHMLITSHDTRVSRKAKKR